jgi:CBS domain-containing protein
MLGQLKCSDECSHDRYGDAKRERAASRKANMKVVEVMNRDVATISPDANLVEAATLMRTRNIFDRNKDLIGLISLDDLAVKMSSDRLLGSVLRQVTAAA